jgi:hypothetical protein
MDKTLAMEVLELFDLYQKQREKAVGSNQTGQLMHGPSSLFGTPGLEPNVVSTIYQPRGLGSVLPRVPTRFTNPLFPALVGQGAAQGSEPTDACGDPKRAGAKQVGTLTAQFGFLQRGTNTIDPSRIIQLINRGEFTDLQLIGSLLSNQTGMAPGGLDNSANVLNNAIYSEMNGVGIEFERVLSTQLWQGAIANNSGSGYKEFPGLDAQIATGQRDAINNVTVPALDSYVSSFQLQRIDGSGNRDIVSDLSMMEFYLTDLAAQTGMNVEWVIAMRPNLWQELTSVWPIAYNTNRGSILAGNNRLMIDGGDMIAQRDAMRRSMTLEINARTYRVVLDNGINEKTNINTAGIPAGNYASSIYMIPVRVNGMPMTRIEHLDYRVIAQYLGQTGELANKTMFWSPDGMFLWVYRDLPGFCFDLVARTEQRVVLQTPHLAGRIDNIRYAPITHLREPDPASPYFVQGGVSVQPVDATFAVWK